MHRGVHGVQRVQGAEKVQGHRGAWEHREHKGCRQNKESTGAGYKGNRGCKPSQDENIGTKAKGAQWSTGRHKGVEGARGMQGMQ